MRIALVLLIGRNFKQLAIISFRLRKRPRGSTNVRRRFKLSRHGGLDARKGPRADRGWPGKRTRKLTRKLQGDGLCHETECSPLRTSVRHRREVPI